MTTWLPISNPTGGPWSPTAPGVDALWSERPVIPGTPWTPLPDGNDVWLHGEVFLLTEDDWLIETETGGLYLLLETIEDTGLGNIWIPL